MELNGPFKLEALWTPSPGLLGEPSVINDTKVLVTQSCPTLCNPMDSPPGSPVHEIFRTRIRSGLPCPPPGDLSHPGIQPVSFMSPVLASRFFTTSTTQEAP